MNQQPQFLFAVADAIDEGDHDGVRALIRDNPEQLHVLTPFAGGTWLHYAARESTLPMVRLLVELGFDVNVLDRDGAGAITRAAHVRRYDTVEYLLDQGARLDVTASVRNPLFAAIVGGSSEIARLLLDRGIDSRVRYDSETMKRMDAVAFAMMQGQREIARMIALHNCGGDEAAAEAALEEGLRIAHENTRAG